MTVDCTESNNSLLAEKLAKREPCEWIRIQIDAFDNSCHKEEGDSPSHEWPRRIEDPLHRCLLPLVPGHVGHPVGFNYLVVVVVPELSISIVNI